MSIFIDACFCRKVEKTPVWLMRQAGRYLKEYQKVRGGVTFLELCKTPELAAEVTIQPVDILGVDAAILFSDILIPLDRMGFDLDFNPAPVFGKPVKTMSDIKKISKFRPEKDVPFVLKTIEILKRELKRKVPLIGFCGAPFTLACYLVQGSGSKDFLELKKMIYSVPDLFHKLMKQLTKLLSDYLNAQIDAGADAIQIFDTWGGIVSPSDYAGFIFPYNAELIHKVKRKNIPVILFVKDGGAFLKINKKSGADVIGLDWKADISESRKILGNKIAVQGNLDPAILFGSGDFLEKKVVEILKSNGSKAGHIFNLGHGVLPKTPVKNVKSLVKIVHGFKKSNHG